MSIPFTQFLRPNGRRTQQYIKRPAPIEAMAKDLINAGYAMEIEELMTGMVSMEVVNPATEEVLAFEICPNGPQVPLAVDSMIKKAHDSIQGTITTAE